ncbi:ANK_REP_REGION domain-containing protein [Trichoderma simmonsii]|uniref:ANK_REP_REGION domain-containing protein n=1 Tax=Trichoderma simmonsii TaxID=1491479 RepID=A0A8G0L639_9HYPO|nr:ANK_REP_REGION domain-containing protein [Trichoderma simmonsii]
MAPIGIIGTITAVIRVCGSSSLRAFIGRAQEGQGTTEAELCTSTSADVCELFNKGGITRVLGRPDIIELIYIPDRGQANQNQQQGQQIPQPRLQLFTSYLEDSSKECWHRMMSSGNGNAVFNKIGRSDSRNSLDLAPKPNLSLNVGIRRQPDWAFYVIALVGFLLQAGILVFAGTAVWLLKWNLQKPSSEASRNYAPGIFIAGTITLCLGAWSCAALIGQTTNEQYYRRSPESSDVLYWIQPGPQVIGDQSFGSFAYSDAKSKDRLMIWTSSTKDFDKNFEHVTYVAVSLILFGYIAQFIGLRGLNAWISIAQLGITILMSILRGILRMKRLDKNNNRLDMWQDLVTGHELDWLAFDIAEQELAKKSKNNSQNTSVEKYHSKTLENGFLWYITGQYEEAIRLDNVAVNGSGLEALNICCENGESSNSHRGDSSKTCTAEWLMAYNNELIQNRTLLSNLTGHFEESMDAKSYLSWKDERVRVRAKAKTLSAMISQTAFILLRNQSNKEDIHLRVKAAISYDKSDCEETIISIKLKPPTGPDRINWSVSSSQIEAILGLWLWSVARREYNLYGKKNGGSDISSLPNKVLNSKIFKVVSACREKQKWDDSLDTDMSLWLGSGDSKYVKQSLDVRLYNSYKYSLADYWILSDEKPVISGQDTNQTSEEDNESQGYQRVGDSSNDSTAGFQRFCGWNLIYDALSTGTSEEEHNDTPERKRVNVKGYFVKDTEHSLLDICAQELFVALLHSMKALEFRKLDKISVSESGGNFRLENPIISALAKCFTDNGLGTHSDAISCLIPSLRSEIPRYQEKMLSALTPVASNYRRDDEWSSAEVVLSWACQYHHKLNPTDTDETSAFMVALRELGELYRWSLAQMQHDVRQEFGARGIEQMASKFGAANPIVALYSTVAKRIKDTRIQSQGWMNEFHHAVKDCRRADALYYLCFAGNFIPHKLSECLPLAARNGWEEIVSALLEMKLSPNIKDGNGRTTVSHCAGSGLWRSLRRLVDMNADLDLADKYNMTPLAYAAMNGRIDVAKLLIQTGQVDPKGSGDSGERSPLWLAVYQGHFRVIVQLIDKGADVNMKNYRGDGLIDLAFRKGHQGVIKLLLECRHLYWEPFDVTDLVEQLSERRNRITGLELSKIRVHPLIWEAWRGNTDVMRVLLNDRPRLTWLDYDMTRDARKLLARGTTLQPLRNHSDGLFSTLDIPPLSSAPIADMHHVKFQPLYSEAPRLMIGISGLSVEQDSPLDMHWEASPVSGTGFTLIRRRDKHGREPVLDSANVTWIEFGAEEQEFQVGNFPPSEHFEGGYVRGTLSKHIPFQNAFKQEPNVVVWLRGLSFVRRDDSNMKISAVPNRVTANGFNMDINASHGVSRSFGMVSMSWLAYPAYSTHIQSGSFIVGSSDYNVVQRQEFTGPLERPGLRFERIPRVFLAFGSLEFIGNEKENIRIEVLLIDREGFDWTCLNSESTPGTVRSGGSVEIQWVAFG